MKYLFSLILAGAVSAIAGPPLICQRIEIGGARSLPWKEVNGWNGAVPSYNVAMLATDTLAILTPTAPLPLRMETLRRAAIYAAKSEAVGGQLTTRLLARVADSEASSKPDPNGWFDAGYFAEALRQIGFIYRFDMLSPAEKAQWKVRGESAGLDGKPWIERAIRLGGKGMEVALVKAEEYRLADMKRLISSK